MGIRFVLNRRNKKSKKQSRANQAGQPFKEFSYGNLLVSVYRSTGRHGKANYRWTLNATDGTGENRKVWHSLKPHDLPDLPIVMHMVSNWFLKRDDVDTEARHELMLLLRWSSVVSQTLAQADEALDAEADLGTTKH